MSTIVRAGHRNDISLCSVYWWRQYLKYISHSEFDQTTEMSSIRNSANMRFYCVYQIFSICKFSYFLVCSLKFVVPKCMENNRSTILNSLSNRLQLHELCITILKIQAWHVFKLQNMVGIFKMNHDSHYNFGLYWEDKWLQWWQWNRQNMALLEWSTLPNQLG